MVKQEKRQAPRLKREIVVHYWIKEAPHIKGVQVTFKPHTDITHTKDLGEKGLYFTAGRAITPSSILALKLRLPIQRETLSLEARVVSCAEIKPNLIYGIRVEFVKLQSAQRRILREFLQLFLP